VAGRGGAIAALPGCAGLQRRPPRRVGELDTGRLRIAAHPRGGGREHRLQVEQSERTLADQKLLLEQNGQALADRVLELALLRETAQQLREAVLVLETEARGAWAHYRELRSRNVVRIGLVLADLRHRLPRPGR